MNLSVNAHTSDDLKSLCTATIRALCGKNTPQTEIIFTKNPAYCVGDILYVREPRDNFTPNDMRLWRGEIDAAVLKRLYYKPVIVHEYEPSFLPAKELYHQLTKIFADIYGAKLYRGICMNLRPIYMADMPKNMNMLDKDKLYIFCVIYNLCPDLLDNNIHPDFKTYYHSMTSGFKKYVSMLDKHRHDFKQFVKICADMSNMLYPDISAPSQSGNYEQSRGELPQANDFASGDNSTPPTPLSTELMAVDTGFYDENMDIQDTDASLTQSVSQNDDADMQNDAGDFDFLAQDFMNISADMYRKNRSDYKIYTKEFDKIITADALCDISQRADLRTQLDKISLQYKGLTTKLASRLMAKLNALYPFRVHDAQSYGRLDSKKLPALVMNPFDEYIYTTQNEHPMRDMALTVLIDNSGSMRGRPITTAAISAEIIAQTLEKCGVKVEILGFTTADWKGGNTKKLWQKNGSSPLPGRLNDLMHIIYKQSHTPYRKAKNNLGVLLKESILKENIDGEALLWAYNRLMNMPQNRKILMVISDGAPVDDSTFSANDSGLLERHLQNMIHFIEKKSPVELVAIGIGHDVSRYYKNAVTIRSPETLTEVMMDSFIKLFDKK